MLRVKRRQREFYVGTLKRRGSDEVGLVVFDPVRGRRGNYISLYELAENTVGDFRAEVVRSLLGSASHIVPSDVELAVDAYCRAVGIDPDAEWLDDQRKDAGLFHRVNSYADLKARYGSRDIPYEELLSTSEWLERRATILDRDGRRCVECGSRHDRDGRRPILQVHHRYYVMGWLPWAYPGDALATLCLGCHQKLHEKELVPVFEAIDGKPVRINRRPCIRCLGAGFFPQYIHIEGGVCFRCRGARFDMEVFDANTDNRSAECSMSRKDLDDAAGCKTATLLDR